MIDLTKALFPDLTKHRAVILGGTGQVGEGIVRSWLKTGAQVIVPSRSEEKIERFKQVLSDLDSPENLHFITGSYNDFDEAKVLASRIIKEFGEVSDVVASIGGWWQGKPLWQISQDEWQQFFVGMSTVHVANTRAWTPLLTKKGSYHLILGGSAVQPVPGASIINIQQAGLLMMRRVLSAEVGDQLRITSQILGPVITRIRSRYDPNWVSNEEVGLVSACIAANSEATDEDYYGYDKNQILGTLQKLGVYPK